MSTHSHSLIIAEAGVNHNGSLELAMELASAARHAGADVVKFQTFKADALVTQEARKARYQRTTVPGDDRQLEMLRALELSAGDFRKLQQHCARISIEFMSSPFDEQSADLLEELEVRRFKIPSGEITNLPLLRHLASKGREIILSTGMCWMAEVETAVENLLEAGAPRVTLLHCVTEYPAPTDEINLRAMLTLEQSFGLPVGYSDHTTGIEIAIAAVAIGATVIEKHLTLDRSMEGPDHSASLNPDEFTNMVRSIRNVEQALGDGEKRPAACEIPNIEIARKSIVAARDIEAGTVITANDLTCKRPGSGISPVEWDLIVGRIASNRVDADSLLTWHDLE